MKVAGRRGGECDGNDHWSATVSYTSVSILYALLVLGAGGLYALLPNPAVPMKRLGVVLLLAALAGLIVLGIRGVGWGGTVDLYFCIFAALALFGAVRVVTHVRPVYSVLYFVLVVLSVAGTVILLDAEFLAAALVIIYVGAILVTYVFVLMLAQQRTATEYDVTARDPAAAVIVGFLLVACVGSLLTELPRLPAGTGRTSVADVASVPAHDPKDATDPASRESDTTAAGDAEPGNVREFGRTLLTHYAVAVEAAGVLLLVAMVGAVWVARHPIPVPAVESAGQERNPPGRIGREVPPF